MASQNVKNQVPNDINMKNKIIPSQHLKSQVSLNKNPRMDFDTENGDK